MRVPADLRSYAAGKQPGGQRLAGLALTRTLQFESSRPGRASGVLLAAQSGDPLCFPDGGGREAAERISLDHVRELCIELPSATTMEAHPTLDVGERVWIPGHSPASDGVGQLERQIEVLTAVPVPPPAIAMHFRVPAYTRRGQHFDMESLGYVVLASWRHDLAGNLPVKISDPYRSTSIWVTMALMTKEDPGLEIAHESPPEPAPDAVKVDRTIARPPAESIRGTILPELVGCSELTEAPWLGLDLTFGPEVDIAEFGFYGPIKPLIDAMGPVLGRDRRGGPADHRLHDLRIRRDPNEDRSVRARFFGTATNDVRPLPHR